MGVQTIYHIQQAAYFYNIYKNHIVIMEHFDIEAMKKKYSDESAEDKDKRNKQQIFPNVLNMIVAIAMIAVGAHFAEADKQGVATHFLKVGGSVLLVSNALKFLSFLTK